MNLHHNITTQRITTDTFIRFGLVLISFLLLWMVKEVLISILVSVVVASAISPIATRFNKYLIPRSVTVFVILALAVSVFVAIFVLLIPMIYTEFRAFSQSFYVFQRDFINYVSSFTGNKQFVSEVVRDWSLEDIQGAVLGIVASGSGAAISSFNSLYSFIFQTVFIFVLSFYLAVLPNGVERFLRVVSPPKQENYIISLWERSQKKIVAWAKGQAILGLIIGVFIFIGLTIIGMENAFLFALLAAVGELIPIVGMLIATIPAVLVALLSGGSAFAVTVLIFYFLVTQFEGHILSPLIVNRIVGIPSVIVIISLVTGGIMAGFWGVLLAVPIAAAVMELVGDIESSKRAEIENKNE